jgi:hypothetical protein
VRQTREAAATAQLVGLDPDSVVAAVREQMQAMGGGGMGAPNGDGGGRRGGGRGESRGDVAVEVLQGGTQGGDRGGRQGQMPAVTDAQCTQVREAFAKAPAAQTTLQGLRSRVQSGEIDQQRSRAISDSIYKAVGLDAMVARACQFRDRQAQGGRTGEGRTGTGGATTQGATNTAGATQGENTGGRRGGRRGNTAAAMTAGMNVPVSQATTRGARPALVYVASGTGFVPRVVRVGMSDLDYTEVVSGLQEGENVLLLTALAMQASRDSALARMRRGGGGMPGMPGGGGQGGGPGRGRGQ